MDVARYLTLILGAVAALVLAVSFAAAGGALEDGWLAWWPECSARLAGGSCALCGMSHAFVAISSGRLDAARSYNSFAPWLYAFFVMLAAASIYVAAGTFIRPRCLQKRTG